MVRRRRPEPQLTLEQTIAVGGGRARCVAVRADGAQLAVGTQRGEVLLVDVKSGSIEHVLKGHLEYVASVAYDPSGELLMSGGKDTTLRVWRAHDGEFVEDLAGIVGAPVSRSIQAQKLTPNRSGHVDAVRTIAWAREMLATGGADYMVKVWMDGRPVRAFQWHNGPVASIAFRPGTDDPYSASYDGTVRAWNLETGAMREKYDGHEHEITALAWVDSQRFVTGDMGGHVMLWNQGQFQPVGDISGGGSSVRCLVGLDAQTVLVGEETGDLVAYDLPPRVPPRAEMELLRIEAHDLAVTGLAVAPSGDWVVSSSDDGTVSIWSCASR